MVAGKLQSERLIIYLFISLFFIFLIFVDQLIERTNDGNEDCNFKNWDQLYVVMRIAEVKLIGKSCGLSVCDGISCTFVCAHQTRIDLSHENIMHLPTTDLVEFFESLKSEIKRNRIERGNFSWRQRLEISSRFSLGNWFAWIQSFNLFIYLFIYLSIYLFFIFCQLYVLVWDTEVTLRFCLALYFYGIFH